MYNAYIYVLIKTVDLLDTVCNFYLIFFFFFFLFPHTDGVGVFRQPSISPKVIAFGLTFGFDYKILRVDALRTQPLLFV
jgi:hypothetical protein